MNKFGIVLGIAAVATLAGCKDPSYVSRKQIKAQDEVKSVPEEEKVEVTFTATTENDKTDEVKAVETKTVDEQPATTAAEEEYTMYIVQRGDYLAKISKKYNIKIDAIKKLNPQIKNDVVKLGQKIKLPGKIDVGEQSVPAGAVAEKKPVAKDAAAKKGYTPYTGATEEYVVKSGDMLGSIAYSHGINVRQLKELNSLKSDKLSIGQKLKVPVANAKSEAAPAPVDAVVAPTPDPVVEPTVEPVPASVEPVSTTPAPAPVVTAVEEDGTYTVKEGDTLMDIAIIYGVTPANIREVNNLAEDAEIAPGTILRLPAGASLQD